MNPGYKIMLLCEHKQKVKYASTEISLAWAAEDVRLGGDQCYENQV